MAGFTFCCGDFGPAMEAKGTVTNEICEMVEEDPRVCYINSDSTGNRVAAAMRKHPDRVLDPGIQEMNMVTMAAGLAKECHIEVAYAIGVARPVSLFVDTKGTGVFADDKIVKIINKEFDLRPYSIIETLDLRRPIYRNTAAYGHFGRSEFPWEQLNKVEDLKKYL